VLPAPDADAVSRSRSHPCPTRSASSPPPSSGKLFEDADGRASRPGLAQARSAATSPVAAPDGEEIPDIVLVLDDGSIGSAGTSSTTMAGTTAFEADVQK
jgi:hypothetical protein